MVDVLDRGYPKLTVGKLKELLSRFDDSLPVVVRARDMEGQTQFDFETYWPNTIFPMHSLEIEQWDITTKLNDNTTIPVLTIGIFP